MKKITLFVLCLLPGLAFADGYKVVTKDGARSLTYYAGQATYSQFGKKIKCKFDKSHKGIDNWGDAYNVDGFSCTKDLFVVIKLLVDSNSRAIIEVDPKTEKKEVFQVDSYKPY
ncbi:TPA: hypothetical protein MD061_004090 [Klebsiella pneumoniae]|nr:hypothetical protein [Klebsiella pneumoniae]